MLTKAELSNIIKEVWSEDFYEDLLPELGIAGYVSNDYEGEIKSFGDKVKIPTISIPGRAQILNHDNEAYTVQVPLVSTQSLEINKSAVYPIDITDWADYQASPKKQEAFRKMIAHEIARAMDQDILDTMAPTTINTGNAAMTLTLIRATNKIFNKLNIPKTERFAIVDEEYIEDILGFDQVLNKDYVSSSSALLDGVLQIPLYSFKFIASNLLGDNIANFWHKSFFTQAIQKGAEYKEMDLEASTNVPSKRIRGKNLFGSKQMDANRAYRITA